MDEPADADSPPGGGLRARHDNLHVPGRLAIVCQIAQQIMRPRNFNAKCLDWSQFWIFVSGVL